MAGILDKKTRFLDTTLTDKGRQELAKGELRFAFATFSDYGTFYEESDDDPDVALDASKRIMFEACSRPQDLIIPEYDSDGGILFPAGNFDITNGELVSLEKTGFLKGEDLFVSSSEAVSDSLNSFLDVRPLRTEETISKTTGFTLSSNSKTFIVDSRKPIPKNVPNVMRLENCESLWQDKKLSHVKNFQHLAPVNKISKRKLFDYPKIQQPTPETFEDLRRELEGDSVGWSGVGESAKIEFTSTSTNNNLICQVWEITSSSINKLRMIDFGDFEDSDPYSPGKHVFFIGKLLDDDAGDKTFINLFTVVFD